MSKELEALKQTVSELIKKGAPIQTVSVETDEVDWENRTMTAIGIDDEVPYINILLGLGSFDLKPKKGTTCLIGLIDNNDTTPFLIMVNEVEEIDVKVENCQLNINNGFLLKKENETLKKLMVDLLQEIQKMKFTTNTGSTILLTNKPQFLQIENRFKNFLK
ncbi:hypothetical protein [Soonwooa sp.]|uniref:hypothetical protein n=1 Tax=Soonwooa sp. TaxID=1938592 RepID=UPI0028A8F93B|nr:hypothetical protein [Soonwooa sp.]